MQLASLARSLQAKLIHKQRQRVCAEQKVGTEPVLGAHFIVEIDRRVTS